MSRFNLTGKVALVAGASRGIGENMAALIYLSIMAQPILTSAPPKTHLRGLMTRRWM